MPPAKLYAELSAYLESMIASGGFAPGDRLPARRKLGVQFGLTDSTVGRALKELEARGLIEMRRGSGCFVRRPASRKGTYNLLVYTEHNALEQTYCGHVILGIQQRAAELGLGVMLRFVSCTDFPASPLRKQETGFDAVLLVGPYDDALREFTCRRPCVGFNMHRSFGCISTVEMDPIQSAELASAYFRRRGVRRVVCFSAFGPDSGECRNVFDFRCRCFRAEWDGECSVCGKDREDAAREIADLPKNTGLWFSSDSRAARILRAYREDTGRDCGDDFPVLSLDGRNWLLNRSLRINSIMPDYRDMGRGAVDEAVRRIEFPGTPCRRIYQSVVLKEKSSKKT